jgi:hypothetical protein
MWWINDEIYRKNERFGITNEWAYWKCGKI